MSFDSQDSNNSLPDAFQLAEFTLQKRIGEGGFSIVYLAKDTSLDRLVAIKEYMPSSLASRSSDLTVSVKSDRYLETFNAGMKSFINEAKLLGQFDHASVVKVYRFFESNGTAYMVMPFYEGRTLKQVLKDMGGPPDEAWLKSLLRPVMDALELIHSYQCFHGLCSSISARRDA
jgi:serine/threonine protein kinase